jgi:hypothetical protein
MIGLRLRATASWRVSSTKRKPCQSSPSIPAPSLGSRYSQKMRRGCMPGIVQHQAVRILPSADVKLSALYYPYSWCLNNFLRPALLYFDEIVFLQASGSKRILVDCWFEEYYGQTQNRNDSELQSSEFRWWPSVKSATTLTVSQFRISQETARVLGVHSGA